ncbi:MAG: NAD(P)/FAD-dependent oxidoreductase [Pyrinomonadaceae bacterium]|nr:NAD(P)/FAD-dependent oxidoreductase [Pyrinomonadaceae bacterium]MCX7639756.1 NAD(P)/FAD-dependent oxidoreductase [Pyrinomonadaceae bacterium]MDW8304339.1 FAD/NAD(P)-binding oxidoreductase [Acidobacteriota bacterium]
MYKVVIVGGGTAGITVAAQLRRKLGEDEIAIIEPSTKHYYQPLWTLVGGGIFPKENSEREEKDYIPDGVRWIQSRVTEFRPEENQVITDKNETITYEYLVVCPGIQINWDKVKGLKESLGKNGVCSNYAYETVDSTWENIQNLKEGIAVFTQPNTPIKCGGAPQKIAYLAEDYFRIHGVRDKIKVKFISGMPSIFSVKKYADALMKHCQETGIETLFKHNLTEIRPEKKEAVFINLDTNEELVQPYDMIHVTPPMGPPDFIKNSPLADSAGWVDVDKSTLQHKKYPNVFGIGDASNLPTSKTGAAIRKQAPVLVKNLLSLMKGEPLTATYDGYTSCPLVTGYDSLILAEFDYDLNPRETFPFDQSKERYSMFLLKKYVLPPLYWYGMLRGRA